MKNIIYNKIFFDFDSTLIKGESLDMLADLRGVGPEVKKMTALSMNGKVPLEEVMGKKMDLIKPSMSDIEQVVQECESLLVDGAKDIISVLHSLKKEVFILSSNFHAIIDPIAKVLRIPKGNVIANDLYFKNNRYQGINMSSALVTLDGKFKMLKQYLKKNNRSVMIGDSVGDLLCAQAVNLFIGFGGVEIRPAVKEKAEVYIEDNNLKATLPFILSKQEIGALTTVTTTTDKNP